MKNFHDKNDLYFKVMN